MEACGILAGKEDKVFVIYRMENTEKSSISFFMEPREQLRVMKDIRAKDLEMLAIYHSHPKAPAYPSARDVELAFYPDASYIIISLLKEEPEVRSFKIRNGKIEEEKIEIIDEDI